MKAALIMLFCLFVSLVPCAHASLLHFLGIDGVLLSLLGMSAVYGTDGVV
jgi:hypothetical protein